MYKCEYTGKIIASGIPQNKIIVSKRMKTYEKKIRRGRNRGQVELVEGWEIVKEITVGPEAYILLTGNYPAKTLNPIKVKKLFKKNKPWQNKKNGWKNSNSKTSTNHSFSQRNKFPLKKT